MILATNSSTNLILKTLLAVSFFIFTGWSSIMAADWKNIEKLIAEQRLKEAEKSVEEILAQSQKKSQKYSQSDWTRCLVTLAQIRIGLHGYETAVEKLKASPWPTEIPDRTIVEIFYAKSLLTYANEYSWEIRQREKTITDEKLDLKKWTSDQIHEEAIKSYDDIWTHRSEIGQLTVKNFPHYITPNNYPDGIRDTMRDVATYKIAETFANNTNWKVSEVSDLYQLNLPELLLDKTGIPENTKLSDPKYHPVARLVYVLKDLESWHYSRKNEEGALEARFAAHTLLHTIFTETSDRKTIRTSLANYLKSHQDHAWAANGFAELASLQQEAGELVNAHKTATECAKKYKNEPAHRCRYVAAAIELPAFHLNGMGTDGLNKRSFELTHKNIKQLYFRAYKIDVMKHINNAKDYNLMPSYQDYPKIIGQEFDFNWTVNLDDTPDFNMHKTYITPPIDKKGFYVVIASAKKDFSRNNNQLGALNFNVSDLVIVHESKSGEIVAHVVNGSSGDPEGGAEVKLFKYDYKSGHQVVSKAKSDQSGKVAFGSTLPQHSYFLVAAKDDDISVESDYIYAYRESKQALQKQAIIYTDRAVYRPKQTIKWKIIAYNKEGDGNLKIAAKTKIEVSLQDGNYQLVKKVKVTTNSFGTAAGEFSIPDGHLLGQWQISSSHGGNAWMRVEEYKRPTFEITFAEIKDELRLNTNVTVEGAAKYYFGSPVSEGNAVYKITRTPIFPWWWRYYFWNRNGAERAQIVASGSTGVKADGSFSISFTPEAKKPTDELGWSKQYRYEVAVDVTDSGGETRSESTMLTAGFITVQAQISKQQPICFSDRECTFEVSRLNLNGVGKSGEGNYKIIALEAPTTTIAPSELPVKVPEAEDGAEKSFHTAGDLMRPRWSSNYTSDEYLSYWREGTAIDKGTLKHENNGHAAINAGKLPPGAYKIEYSTKDGSGRDYKTWQYVISAASGYNPNMPIVLEFDRSSEKVGSTIRLFASVGFGQKRAVVKLFHKNKVIREVKLTKGSELIEIPLEAAMRGGISASLDLVSDYQYFRTERQLYIPWDNKELSVSFESLREVMKPGVKETITIKIKGADAKEKAAEVMAFMYDKSLDLIAKHYVYGPLSLFPTTTGISGRSVNLDVQHAVQIPTDGFNELPTYTIFYTDTLNEIDGYGIGGGGGRHMKSRSYNLAKESAADGSLAEAKMEGSTAPAAAPAMAPSKSPESPRPPDELQSEGSKPAGGVQLRENFAETAFFAPQLTTDGNGEAKVTFTLPDSLTTWHIWAVALMKDFSSGVAHKEVRTAKDLMVRLYSPRFFREGDKAAIKVVVNNSTKKDLNGKLQVSISDEITGENLEKEFKIKQDSDEFSVNGEGSTSFSVSMDVPAGMRNVKIKAVATSGVVSDGEIRTVPVLPGRMHLVQSRFVALRDQSSKRVEFTDLRDSQDSSLINEKMVVTIDGQLFFSTLKALPYLIEYPYECTEQTLNRFLSAGIMSSLFSKNPKLRKAAASFAERKSEYEPWNENDPNSRMQLEESPWLGTAKGGRGPSDAALINILKAEVADQVKSRALAKLGKYQTASGGFPWFPGGAPSPYMTLYLVYGFAKAQEFDIDIPKNMVKNAWRYLSVHFRESWENEDRRSYEFLTFLNFTASSFSDKSVYNDVFPETTRKEVLDYSFKHWKKHSPYLKLMLSLTLHRMNRAKDAELVLGSVLDSATTSEETGTSWAAEDRSWLWYNDTIETHAFALRVLTEIQPQSPINNGIVHWLFMNKKLNQWKSTKATAEVVYSLATWLRKSGEVFPQEKATVKIGSISKEFVFPAEKYVGRQFVEIKGPEVTTDMSAVSFKKELGGLMFASATWHYSTELLPEQGRGDFFTVDRKYFLRKSQGSEMILVPLSGSQPIVVGDEVEVQVSIRNKHQAEFVHLRDPRPAGFEPVTITSGHRWDLGISWYEEIRDNGTNFFFDWLPEGEYTFKYRLRAANAGVFRAMPAEIQSMYAPEFNAFSSGRNISIK